MEGRLIEVRLYYCSLFPMRKIFDRFGENYKIHCSFLRFVLIMMIPIIIIFRNFYYSAVQTPSFSPPAPAGNLKVQQIYENSKFKGIYNILMREHFCLLFNTLHSLHQPFVLCTI